MHLSETKNIIHRWIIAALLIVIAVMVCHLINLNYSLQKEYHSLAFEVEVSFNEVVHRTEQFAERSNQDIESFKELNESCAGLISSIEMWQEFLDETRLSKEIRRNIEASVQQVLDLNATFKGLVEYHVDEIEIKDQDKVEQFLGGLKESEKIFEFERIMTIKNLKQSFAEN